MVHMILSCYLCNTYHENPHKIEALTVCSDGTVTVPVAACARGLKQNKTFAFW